MTRKNSFLIIGEIANADDVTAINYSYIYKGRTLDQGAVNRSGLFTIRFRSSKKSLNGNLVFEDLNTSSLANFKNADTDYSLASSELVRFKAKAKDAPQLLGHEFSLANPIENVLPAPPDSPATINLTASTDIYSSEVGGQLIGTTFVDTGKHFTKGADSVIAQLGTLNSEDDLADATAGDNDQITIYSDASHSVGSSLTGTTSIRRLSGIENLVLQSSYDPGGIANLEKVHAVQSMTMQGSLQANLLLRNTLLAGVRRFNFSGISNSGIDLQHGSSPGDETSSPLLITGSTGNDTLDGSNGPDTISGGRGSDRITGGAGNDVMAGGIDPDMFRYTANGQTATTGSLSSFIMADIITDFTVGIGGDVAGFVNEGGFDTPLNLSENRATLANTFLAKTVTLVTLDTARLADATAGKPGQAGNAAILVVNTTAASLEPLSNNLASLNNAHGLQIIGLEGQSGINFADFTSYNFTGNLHA